jgi:hypothetical protein
MGSDLPITNIILLFAFATPFSFDRCSRHVTLNVANEKLMIFLRFRVKVMSITGRGCP